MDSSLESNLIAVMMESFSVDEYGRSTIEMSPPNVELKLTTVIRSVTPKKRYTGATAPTPKAPLKRHRVKKIKHPIVVANLRSHPIHFGIDLTKENK